MLLNDYETGKPVAVLDGKVLTALRTGAVGGVAIRYTTPQTVKSVGLVGAGTQGFYQLLYACKARNIEKITIFDIHREGLPSFKERLKKELPFVTVETADNVEDVLKQSEVVITATTSNEPVLPENPRLLEGRHFIGIGSYKPDMREYPEALFKLLEKVYVDAEYAKEETGDLVYPLNHGLIGEDQIETFGHFLLYEKNKSDIAKKTTFFKSVGMALFDLTVSQLVYKKAKVLNLGQKARI